MPMSMLMPAYGAAVDVRGGDEYGVTRDGSKSRESPLDLLLSRDADEVGADANNAVYVESESSESNECLLRDFVVVG